jgi:hypothetical protein
MQVDVNKDLSFFSRYCDMDAMVECWTSKFENTLVTSVLFDSLRTHKIYGENALGIKYAFIVLCKFSSKHISPNEYIDRYAQKKIWVFM